MRFLWGLYLFGTTAKLMIFFCMYCHACNYENWQEYENILEDEKLNIEIENLEYSDKSSGKVVFQRMMMKNHEFLKEWLSRDNCIDRERKVTTTYTWCFRLKVFFLHVDMKKFAALLLKLNYPLSWWQRYNVERTISFNIFSRICIYWSLFSRWFPASSLTWSFIFNSSLMNSQCVIMDTIFC